MKIMKRIGFALLGVVALLSLLCSIAASAVTNGALLKEGFLQFSDTAHLSVKASSYEEYAGAVSAYLDGKSDYIQVSDPENPGQKKDAFSEKENLHMQDVRGLVNLLKSMRWIGGGLALAVIAGLYLFGKDKRSMLMKQVFRGFSDGAMALLTAVVGIGIWGVVNFDGLFWTFHQVGFANDLWLLNPATDLLVALMPVEFFTWYAGEMLKSFLPVFGIMLCLIIAWYRVGKKEA
ncbi:MAG: DUF1461 domain-containing protein [Clostridia bacterium]|nr:DUF1461 domain-containing protein [Clostridia bacterium]